MDNILIQLKQAQNQLASYRLSLELINEKFETHIREEILKLLRNGQKIQAIVIYRAFHPEESYQNCVEAVETLEVEGSKPKPTRFNMEA